MQCPKCGYEISDLAIFCLNCGEQIKKICPECGETSLVEATFCSQCGFRLNSLIDAELITQRKNPDRPEVSPTSIQKKVDPYERRTVTILFVDIIGSTSIAEKIDPEFVADIMHDTYPSLIEPIQANYGSIVQVMGDGVLAYFGAPLVREDDPERAVLAGLEIVDRVKKVATKLRQEHVLEDFHVRVGINTGLVVIGELYPEKDVSYIALGDAVNLAARLQQNAPKDSVLISQSTYQQIKGLFEIQQQGAIPIKGRDQVVETFLVKKRKPNHLWKKQRGLEGVATTMVGREPEIAALKNIYRDAMQGEEASLVLITGDPGIGKTRLLEEFVAWVASNPIVPALLQGRSIPGTKDVPYGVLRNLFARSFKILETDTTDQAIAKFREGTQQYIPTEQADFVGQMVGFDFKTIPTIRSLLGSASFREISELYFKNYLRCLAETSLLIILEDLQWMDDRTLELLSAILNDFSLLTGLKLMVLCTARPKFFEAHHNWGEDIKGYTKLQLRNLSRRQSRSLVDEILYDHDHIPDAFYQRISGESDGNPFFIEEMIRMFYEEGVITIEDSSPFIRTDRLEELHVPSTLKGILGARIDLLPPPEKDTIQRAAIIGRTFWDGLIMMLIEDESEAREINLRLDSLCRRGLIIHRGRSTIAENQQYMFKHALLRDEAYESVLLKHRKNYHQRVAVWIEEHAGDRLEEHLAMIAYHSMKGGHRTVAADWYSRAGEKALSQFSMHEAKNLFERAINLISDQDLSRLWRATLGHDEAVGMLGELDTRHSDDQTLLSLAKKLKDEKLLSEAYYRIGSQAISEGKNEESLQAFNKALEISKKTGDLKMQALILPMKVNLLTSDGDLTEAGSLVDQAMVLARQTEDTDILVRALTNIAPYFQAIGDVSQSVALMHEQIDINQKQGNRLGETYGLINLGYFYLSLGHFKNAHRLLQRAYQIACSLEAKICVAYSMLNLGLAEWRLSRPHQAVEILESSGEFLEALGDLRGLANRQFYLGLSNENAKAHSKAIEHFTAAYEAFETLDMSSGMIEAQAGLARLAFREGDVAKAKVLALHIDHYLDQEGPEGLELPILVYLSCLEVFEETGDTAMFEHAIEEGSKMIQNRLEKIRKEDWKEVYIDKIPENCKLILFRNKLIKDVKEVGDLDKN